MGQKSTQKCKLILLIISLVNMVALYNITYNKPGININKCKNPRYFIYNDLDITMNDWNRTCTNESVTDTVMLDNLKKHRFRTYDPEKACYFVIPTQFLQSLACDENKIHNVHMKRANRAMSALVNHTHFNGGLNHILPGHSFYFSHWMRWNNPIPQKWWDSLENVTFTRYEYYRMSRWENSYKVKPRKPWIDFHRQWEITKHSIVTPYATDIDIVKPDYTQWRARRNLIWYHTRTKKSWTEEASNLRRLPIKANLSGDIGFDVPMDRWRNGWVDSKFCLVIRGDTPTSHAFYRAIAAACVPVIISDPFDVGVPFGIDITLFSVIIPEETFTASPHIETMLEALSEETVKLKLKGLEEVQPKVLYHHPQSQVIELLFKQMLKIN